MKQGDFAVDLIKKVTSEKFYFGYIVSFMILMPLCELISQLLGAAYLTLPFILNSYSFFGIISCASMLYLRLKSKEIYPSDIFFLLLIFFALISLIFTKQDQGYTTSYFSGERPLYFMLYFSVFFAAASLNDISMRKKILYTFIIVSAINGIVALLQSFGIHLPGSITGMHIQTFCYGLTFNFNWFAGLTIILAAVCAGMLIFTEKGNKLRLLYLVLTILIMYVSFCTEARISLLGNIAIVCFYIVSFIVMNSKGYDKKKLHSHIMSFLAVIVCYAAVVAVIAMTRDTFKQMFGEFYNDMTRDFDSFGSRRGYIWRFGVEAIPHNWLTGVGLDNFAEVFTGNPRWHEGMEISNKAHNEYLHTIVTEGIFAGINYIALIVYVSVISVKNIINTNDEQERYISWILFGAVASYAAQAFVNSSLPNVVPYFWIAMGMCIHTSLQTPIKLGRKNDLRESA